MNPFDPARDPGRTAGSLAAGADAVGTFELKARDLLAQAEAYRTLSSSLAYDEAEGAHSGR